MAKVARICADRMLRLLAVGGVALALGACTKCDVPYPPDWMRGGAPASCHGDAPTQ